MRYLEAAPLRLIDQLRAHFYPKDRSIIPAADCAVVLQAGLLADRPATPIADGHAYYGTDTNTLYIGDAGAWVSI